MRALDRLAFGFLLVCCALVIASAGYRLLASATTGWDVIADCVVMWGFAFLFGVLVDEWITSERTTRATLARLAKEQAERRRRDEQLFADYPYLKLRHTCLANGLFPGSDPDCPRCAAIFEIELPRDGAA